MELPPHPRTNTHTQTQKQHVLSVWTAVSRSKRDSSYRPWIQTEKYITKCFISLLVMETGDTGKSNRGPVALIWAVTWESSRRWIFEPLFQSYRQTLQAAAAWRTILWLPCFVRVGGKKRESRKTGEEQSWYSSPGENYIFALLWSINYETPILHITAKNIKGFFKGFPTFQAANGFLLFQHRSLWKSTRNDLKLVITGDIQTTIFDITWTDDICFDYKTLMLHSTQWISNLTSFHAEKNC